jgi:protein-export membrane protein SecD
MRRYPGLFLTLIVLLAVLGGFFVYPKSPVGGKWRPWRLGLDLAGGTELTYAVDLSRVAQGDQESVLNGLRDVIERRVNFFGVSEPEVFIARGGGRSELHVKLAGVKDIDEAVRQIGETPFLEFSEVLIGKTEAGKDAGLIFTETELTGRYITGARLDFDEFNRPQVALTFNSDGAKMFEDLTGKIAAMAKTEPDPACNERGPGRRLAVFLDNQPITVPCVYEAIAGGNAVITGNFTLEEAKKLVERFNAGALPAPITLSDEFRVSSGLGADSLKTAISAGLIGTALVMLFMIGYYRLLGVFASLALLIYIVLTLSVFKLTPLFTLTLAGLAGFILTIGMAVDANILIFERAKEEMKKGLSRRTAMEEGFRRAWPSIRDSNTSTIITAAILYFLTSSFVRGFALTLFIGTLISMFSAITTTRLFLQVFLRDKTLKPQTLNSKL